jgi:hypothetical protein
MRFNDTMGARPRYLWDFIGNVLVECPNCRRCAVVECSRGLRGTPRLTCPACALSRRGWPPPSEAEMRRCARRRCPRCNAWLGKAPLRFRKRQRTVEVRCPCGAVCSTKFPGGSMTLGDFVDPYFGLPLWLRADVQGRTLWAYNREHLSFLDAYVRAGVRQRAPNRNASLASRLPRWLKASGVRQPVLRAIARVARR